jgi:hypothetical protein
VRICVKQLPPPDISPSTNPSKQSRLLLDLTSTVLYSSSPLLWSLSPSLSVLAHLGQICVDRPRERRASSIAHADADDVQDRDGDQEFDGVDTEGLEVAGVLERETELFVGWVAHGRRVLVSLCFWVWYVLERVWWT